MDYKYGDLMTGHTRGDRALIGATVVIAPLLAVLLGCGGHTDHRPGPKPPIPTADAARHARTMQLCDDTVTDYMQDQMLGEGARVNLTTRAAAKSPQDVDGRVADAIVHGLYAPGLTAGNLEPRYEGVISACKRAGWSAS